jgi:hypothetical protein
MAAIVNAQNSQRKANITGGGNPDQGKCTVEVVVDGAAEIEIRGDTATMRNLSGQPSQWRRFQCNSPMPANPAEFRFSGVDGRGSQQLLRDPRNGGSAVIRIEDRDNGSEGYTFDIFWRGGGRDYVGGDRGGVPPPQQDRGGFGPPPQQDRGGFGPPPQQDRGFDGPPPRDQDRGFGGPPPRDYNRERGGQDRRFTTEQAIRVCQDWVREQAGRRLGTSQIDFRRTVMDDKPGRDDWVLGNFAVARRGDRQDFYSFSCSVDFDSGRVRSADFRASDRPYR